MAGAFYVQDSTAGVTSSANTFRYCYPAKTGGIFSLISTKLTDSSSSFYQNSALNGGVIKCDGCTMTLTGSVFRDNMGVEGGVMLLDN